MRFSFLFILFWVEARRVTGRRRKNGQGGKQRREPREDWSMNVGVRGKGK
jgi:hypothetical protein